MWVSTGEEVLIGDEVSIGNQATIGDRARIGAYTRIKVWAAGQCDQDREGGAMTREELDEVLRLHALWLAGEAGGEQADLSGADLSGANLWWVIGNGAAQEVEK